MSVSVLDPETDIMDQFLDPETDIMGERTFMRTIGRTASRTTSTRTLYFAV